MKLSFSVWCLFLLFCLVRSQEAPSGVICTTCACADSRVDCANKDIRASFSVDEWKALETFRPTEIDLSRNRIATLSKLPALPVQNLTVSKSELEVIESGCFKHLRDTLVTLDLSNNKITTSSLDRRIFMTTLEGDKLLQFNKLTFLSLANNDIHSLPKDLFFTTGELTHLDLSGNPLAYIDTITLGTISDVTKLRNLSLSSCDLETLPEGIFRRLRRLQGLDLSGNRFTTVPATINEASNLQVLFLDKNPFETINDNTPFKTLIKLRELYIRRCSKLKSITAGALGGLESLSILHISYNPRLSTLEPKFLVWEDDDEVEKQPLIKELYLNNNNITEISAYYLDRWNLLAKGDFTNNPYDCDCDSQWMVDVLIPLLQDMVGCGEQMAYMTCKTPEPFRGLTYNQVLNSTRHLICMENLEQPVTDSAIMLGIMIGVFVTFPMVILVVLLWRRGIFTKCRKKVIEMEEEKDMF
ncbi:leucine-rich repeat neuronal protein 1-like [Cydia strobilella]|uniref:leucine-rich repeat neuronal protein 1-like n=1 Tax=Cydia strobilella TaxID=1100964 RepID=UPI003003B2C9